MKIDPVFVVAVLSVVGLLRVVFAVAHGALYLALAAAFRGLGKSRWVTAGRAMARAAIALPIAGLALSAHHALSEYPKLPPGGMRRIVEIPMAIGIAAIAELVPGAVLASIVLVLLAVAKKRARGT